MTRIHKVIASSGYCSRREAERLINNGKVEVNGKLATIGQQVEIQDKIFINGMKIKNAQEEFVYYLLNKPRGYISSTSDEKGRKCVTDLVPKSPRVFPVGRLDYNTTGALFLTNDGELMQTLTNPKNNSEKRYIAVIKGKLPKEKIIKLQDGVVLETGYKTKRSKLRVLTYEANKDRSKVRVTLTEGKKHQIKLMFKAVGHLVDKLHRESFSIFTIKGIPSGKYINIDPIDIKQLKK